MQRGKFLDLVVCGPDMSGTSTQIKYLINFFKVNGMKVRDIRGTEIEALFHTEPFKKFNENLTHLSDLSEERKKDFLLEAYYLMSGGRREGDLAVASSVKNDISTYLNPDSADVWIMEEPTKRGAGQVNRAIEQNRSDYGEKMDPYSAAVTHSVYRIDEFLRFRKIFREKNKIIVRSRSEESACYQIYDKENLSKGILPKDYLSLPGHKFAFGNSPTDLFIVSGPKDWTQKDYLELKEKRSKGRKLDNHEKNSSYQVLVNKRYATNWIENLYLEGTKMHGGKMPNFERFNIYDSEEAINRKMAEKISFIL
ncbi:hypothetical protein GW931_02520 [archaeon]|nr:hypothetical protein [archaeon]